MPRRKRYAPPGSVLHVTNRGVERRRLFFEDADYEDFVRLFAGARERHRVKLFALCVMPNHFHALIKPEIENALSAYLRWVQGCYACDLRVRTQTCGHGHVFQQRFWSGVINDDYHFLNVLRYIEANPSEAGLVPRAEGWPWNSLSLRISEAWMFDPLPIALPADWPDRVNEKANPYDAD